MRTVVIFAALAIGAGLIVPHYATQSKPAPAMMAPRPAASVTPASSNSRAVEVARSNNGHFEVEGHIDGRRITFMVDTGASAIAINERSAAMLGIHPAERDFSLQIKTANGTVRGAPVTLDRVEVGDLMVRNVSAVVLPDAALSDNLLGMSFLSRLRRFEMASGRLVLEQ
jgi:aspartyl protease family protein